MIELRYKPLDTLFFRDGKPFTLGEETWADGQFPPNPSVLFGALRTALATLPGREIPFPQVESILNAEKLSIHNIYYWLSGAAHFPLPFDYVENKEKGDGEREQEERRREYKVHLLTASIRKSIVSKEKAPFLKYTFIPPFDQVEKLVDGLVSKDNLLAYLNSETPEIKVRKISDFVAEEPKVGNGRNNYTRTVEEGLLYRVGMQRMKGDSVDEEIKIGLTFKADGYEAPELYHTMVRLGGEGKVIALGSAGANVLNFDTKEIKIKPGYFKIYLATSAIFTEKEWQPDLTKLDVEATLIGACMGKPLSIGGYNMFKNEPRPMYKAVPAGSVFYYETNEDPAKIESLQGRSVSDILENQGYGIAYFGNFTPMNPT